MDPKTQEILKAVRKNFLKELKDAASGKKTSLVFIKNQIPQNKIVQEDEVFQVIVTGGSICKVAKVKYQSGKIKILQKQETPVDAFNTKEDFLQFVLNNLDNGTKTLAINFTFAIQPILENGKLDGKLITPSKEHKFEGLIGKNVGKEVEKYVFLKTKRKLQVSVGNDTVCLLLSALTQYSPLQVAAGVVGTGINFSIFQDKNTIRNLEAANFNKFSPSKETKEIDRQSARPGDWIFEKEIAGAYLYKQFNIMIKSKNIDCPPINSTAQLNAIANKNLGETTEIARYLFEKSAGLVASVMAAITDFSQRDLIRRKDRNDLIFVMEGSLFWHSLRPKIERYLKQLAPEYRTKFAKIENSEILGAAKLVS